MATKGKITAAQLSTLVNPDHPVRVLLTPGEIGPHLAPATRRTGVETLAVTRVTMVRSYSTKSGLRRAQRFYRFTTSAGDTCNVSPGQTFILAPEDAPAVKRAHAEALEIQEDRLALESLPTEALIGIHRAAQEDRDSYRMNLVERIVEARNAKIKEEWDAEQARRALDAMAPPEPEESGPLAGSGVRTGTAMERPFLAPIERPEQEPRYTTDQRLLQLLAMLDDGIRFELHPDGWWRDRDGNSGGLLDTVALKDAVNEAYRAGLVGVMGANGRHVANPTLAPAPVHQAVATGTRYRPLCGSTPYDRMGPIRRRYTHRAVQVTCPACIDMAAELKRQAEALAQKIRERGIVVDALVTIHRGVQRYTVVRVEEDMVQVAPNLSEEDRRSIEAAGGVIRELQWVSWDLLHAVPTAKV